MRPPLPGFPSKAFLNFKSVFPFLSRGKSALEKGRSGEEKARNYLESKGYKFLGANYRTRLGEVDLIVEKGETLVFVEVKARENVSFGTPQESVTPSKQRKVVKAALEFIKRYRYEKRPLRFDVVSITQDRVEHTENAFGETDGLYTL